VLYIVNDSLTLIVLAATLLVPIKGTYPMRKHKNTRLKQLQHIAASTLFILLATPRIAGSLDLSGRSDADMAQDASRKPVEIINFAGVKKGDNVLDLLAGGGYYTELIARRVGEEGNVVLQIPKAYLKYVDKEVKQRLADDRLSNVDYLLSEAPDLKLEKNNFDSAFLVLGYHDMFFKEDDWDFSADVVIPQVLQSLKVGGKLLVIDHSAEASSGIRDIKTLHRIDASFVVKDLEKRGFRLIKESNTLSNVSDDRSKLVFNPELRRKTDRFVMLFEKVI
jgi:predicted methyltransferase